MKVQLPFIGNASGTTAGMIYQCYRGRTYMRAKPWLYHYPDTKLQQATQAAFYNIQRQWLPIYDVIKANVTKQQRGNINLFNTMSSGIYQAAQTYVYAQLQGPPRKFGIDTSDEVVIKTASTAYTVTDKQIKFSTVVQAVNASRRFAPMKYFLLCVNYKEQLLMLHYNDFLSPSILVELTNAQHWQTGLPARFYLALADEQFFTNFTLCEL